MVLKCSRLFSKASLNIAIVPHFPRPPCPMWVCEILEWHRKRQFSQQEKWKQNHHTPWMVLRRSVRLMNTYASLEAKRTPDIWEGIPRLKWNYTWAKYAFTHRLVLKILYCSWRRGWERVPLAPWLGGDTDNLILQWIHHKRPHTHRYFFFSQQSKYKVKHNWAIVLVMHNVYASKNRRKIEKSTLTKVSPGSLPAAPMKGPWKIQENNP